jgi:outer membrane protein assembly factor BamE (lipoprotein component of BamABCDE complex)
MPREFLGTNARYRAKMRGNERLSQRPCPWARCAVTVALCIGIVACTPRLDTRGYQFDPDTLSQIVPGTHTRDDVAEILGSPSSTAIVAPEVWYYIGNQTETLAFFEPKVTERQVVTIVFDDEGVVSTIDAFGLERSRRFEFVERETPTTGSQLTLLDQLLGNLGRFNKAGEASK